MVETRWMAARNQKITEYPTGHKDDDENSGSI